MPAIRKTATARVTLTVEVSVRSTWGDDCKLDQVYRQAEEQARGHLNRCFAADDNRARIVGRAKIEAVIAERDAR